MANTLDPKRLHEVFASISENMQSLSKWEQNFIESVSDKYDRRGWLSDNEMDKLEQIYLKVP